MKIITVAALKGGVGKTNFVFNLSTLLASKKHKVLVIDLDPQGNLSRNYKFSTNDPKSKKLFNPSVNIEKDDLIMRWEKKDLIIDVIPTNIAMTTLEEELHLKTARETVLKRSFRENYDFLKNYDYIIFDTNPSINIVNKNALLISDEIIIMSDNSTHSLQAIDMLSNNWDAFCKELGIKNKINSIVLNNFDHYKISQEFVKFLEKSKFKDKILKTHIKRKQSLKKAEFTGVPSLFIEKEKHIYHEIFNELKEKGVL